MPEKIITWPFGDKTPVKMATNMQQLQNLANEYRQVLSNTQLYRSQWQQETKARINQVFGLIIESTGLQARVQVRGQIENLEAIVFDLGRSSSGLSESLENTDLKHTMVKNNGSLIYQQLFNGKLMVMLNAPHIEGYGEPKPPRTLEIIRPDEITPEMIFGHVERMLTDIVEWEDFDDDDRNKKVAFQPIGFQHSAGGQTVA